MFLHQSDRRCYGKLLKELKNSFTRGNDHYPGTLVKAFHLISEYKHYEAKVVAPDASTVAFAQKNGVKTKDKGKDNSWKLKATCHQCGVLGHIQPDCPQLNSSEDDKSDGKKTNSGTKSNLKDSKSAEKSNKKTPFAQSENSESKQDEGESASQFTNFGFVNPSSIPVNL
jgi:hypothetical protein